MPDPNSYSVEDVAHDAYKMGKQHGAEIALSFDVDRYMQDKGIPRTTVSWSSLATELEEVFWGAANDIHANSDSEFKKWASELPLFIMAQAYTEYINGVTAAFSAISLTTALAYIEDRDYDDCHLDDLLG